MFRSKPYRIVLHNVATASAGGPADTPSTGNQQGERQPACRRGRPQGTSPAACNPSGVPHQPCVKCAVACCTPRHTRSNTLSPWLGATMCISLAAWLRNGSIAVQTTPSVRLRRAGGAREAFDRYIGCVATGGTMLQRLQAGLEQKQSQNVTIVITNPPVTLP